MVAYGIVVKALEYVDLETSPNTCPKLNEQCPTSEKV